MVLNQTNKTKIMSGIVNLVRLYMSAEGITERMLLIFTEIKVVWALLGSKYASQ